MDISHMEFWIYKANKGQGSFYRIKRIKNALYCDFLRLEFSLRTISDLLVLTKNKVLLMVQIQNQFEMSSRKWIFRVIWDIIMDSKATNPYPIVWEPMKGQMLHISLLILWVLKLAISAALVMVSSCNGHWSWKIVFVSKSSLLFQSDVFSLLLFSLLLSPCSLIDIPLSYLLLCFCLHLNWQGLVLK